jgi:ATP-dependent helicase/nuclease subunit A
VAVALTPQKLEAERRRTEDLQRGAADPAVSAWVSANAGTGKTHVLTMRVLRLLIQGTPPDRILCLTYTKAAAAEMSQRVFQRLSGWVTIGDAVLDAALSQLLGRAPGDDERQRARQLFAQAIETPGGLKVQTIHAFCERLLQRFPLEAGIPPHFAILDEQACRDLQREAIDDLLTEATRNRNSDIGLALGRIVAYAADDRFDELLRDALIRRDWLEAASRFEAGGGPMFSGAEALYRRAFGVSPDVSLEEIETRIVQLLSEEHWRTARDILAGGSARDVEGAERVAAVLDARTPQQRADAVCNFFITSENGPRKSLMTKGIAAERGDVLAYLSRAQAELIPLQAERGHLRVIEATMALLCLADAVMQRYTDLKARRAALDFDDLIRKTALLLSHHASAEWVLFKLDGGLDHILVDEAQDTSPIQWDVIEALATEFFAGTGARESAARTLFAVGDEKQSIYGFQGARPELFARLGRTFAKAAQDADLDWRHVPLTLSFRSVAPVLAAVDAVFADRNRTRGITAGDDPVKHFAMRLGHAGLVEIWETEKSDEVEPADAWTPLDDKPSSSPIARLARRIADTIKHWLASGEILASANRPIQPSDILILVRKRRPFAEAMVAELKARGIPVAGADRIRLADQIAAQDLMAVGDFILLPEDDLVLATLLKSPLFDLNDDDLIAIAPNRKGSLWSALLAAAESQPRFRDAAETLKRWRARADYAPPFEFYAELLNSDHGRTRLLERLGAEAAEPIDEFLDLALKFDDGAPPSLQGFLTWLRQSDVVIKRDMEHGRGEVRVMTVHGAKGLEAPIVFLPDTCTTRSGERPGGLVILPGMDRPERMTEPFCWPVKGTGRTAGVRNARQAAGQRETEERNRLLYVALTRPRDRLYVAGFEGVNGRDDGCWYDLIADAVLPLTVETRDHQGLPVRRLATTQDVPQETAKDAVSEDPDPLPLPDWALKPARQERDLAIPFAPSRLAPPEIDAEGDPVDAPAKPRPAGGQRAPGPVAMADGHRFARGLLTHGLLQYLPSLDRRGWKAAAGRFVAIRGAGLPQRTRDSIVTETLAVLNDPAFAALFGPDSRAEVPIVAEIASPGEKERRLRLNGQVDRLVRVGKDILIVDYKTNRPPPQRVEDVAEAYTLQLAAYRLAVRQVFGTASVRAALLWTDGPRIMEIPDVVLDNAEKRVFTVDRASLDAGGGGT